MGPACRPFSNNILDRRRYTGGGAIVYVKLYLKLNPVLQHFSHSFSCLERQESTPARTRNGG